MVHQSALIATDIGAYLQQHRNKELLRFLTCGSVDDGKSTLIGRLLHDANLLYEDQFAAAKSASSKHGTTGEDVDLALLVDGLKAEREQGITIDVAYRYFSTARRKFIIADCPGHEQYTRNMATGASTSDLAIILIDARKGVLSQTKRHSFIVSLLGIKHAIVAVNKMDLVDHARQAFDAITDDYRQFASKLDIPDIRFIPISARFGDNVVDLSKAMPWYKGATLMHLLENVHIASDRNLVDFRFPVQTVLRPHADFRGFAGTVASGMVRLGDDVMALPSLATSKVASIVTYDGTRDDAFAPQSVVLTLVDEIDVSRGDMLVHPNNRPRVSDDFQAMLVWMGEESLRPGDGFLIKQTSRTTNAHVTEIVYGVDVNTMHRVFTPSLSLNQIARCRVQTSQPLFVDTYRQNRTTGAFILVDRVRNTTVAAGMVIERHLASKDHWDTVPSPSIVREVEPVSIDEKQARFQQKPTTVLFTGLAGSGKTHLAHAVERRLFAAGRAVACIDGQQMRHGMSRDLGFGVQDRSENLRRGAEVARLFNDAGLIVLAAFVAPEARVRERAARVIGADRFVLVHVDCPVEVCRTRDRKGMYALADAGEIGNFPGVTSRYEAPTKADLVLHSDRDGVDGCADAVVDLLRQRQAIP